MSICLPAHLVNATNQDVTTPLSLQLYWLETIKGEPSFTVQDELTTKTCGYRARQNNNLAAFTQGKMSKLAFRLALGIWRYFNTSTVPPPGQWTALSTGKNKKSSQQILIYKPPMLLKAIINSIMSGRKMSFPKEEYQIMAEDGQSGSESLKQINGGLKGIQDWTKGYQCAQPNCYRCA